MIAMDETDISFFKDGLRLDGRKADELRPVKIEVGVLARADGSCYIEMGGNKVIAAVYGPREVHPRHLQEVTRAIVRYRYNMASFSVEDRKRPVPRDRSFNLTGDKIGSLIPGDALPSRALPLHRTEHPVAAEDSREETARLPAEEAACHREVRIAFYLEDTSA